MPTALWWKRPKSGWNRSWTKWTCSLGTCRIVQECFAPDFRVQIFRGMPLKLLILGPTLLQNLNTQISTWYVVQYAWHSLAQAPLLQECVWLPWLTFLPHNYLAKSWRRGPTRQSQKCSMKNCFTTSILPYSAILDTPWNNFLVHGPCHTPGKWLAKRCHRTSEKRITVGCRMVLSHHKAHLANLDEAQVHERILWSGNNYKKWFPTAIYTYIIYNHIYVYIYSD